MPQQFQQPHVRPWSLIAWNAISPEHLLGFQRDAFCALLAGAINTEAPIRGDTQSSRQYLAALYPDMANFVGGCVDASGSLVSLGLWEREKKRHTPALIKLYTQLQGEPPAVISHPARPYQAEGHPRDRLYRHGLHRIATEYGATCLYLWIMAHTTGPLQAALGELLIDEVNHMTKFWGFGVWAYPDSSLGKISRTLYQAMR